MVPTQTSESQSPATASAKVTEWIGNPGGARKFSKKKLRWYKNRRVSNDKYRWCKIKRKDLHPLELEHMRLQRRLAELIELRDTSGFVNGNNNWVIDHYLS